MIILPEDKAIISLLSADDAHQVLLALFSTEDDLPKLTPIAHMAYTAIKIKSERISEQKSRAGKMGGAPKNNQNAKKQAEQAECEKTSKTSHRTVSVTDTVSVTGTGKEKESGATAPPPSEKPAKPEKHKHGEYGWVKLTDAEYQRLVRDHGEEAANHYIAVVDELAQQTGNKNKWQDWNLTVRKAIRNQWGAPYQPHNSRGQPQDDFLTQLAKAAGTPIEPYIDV